MKRLQPQLFVSVCLAAGLYAAPARAQEATPFQPARQSLFTAEDQLRHRYYNLAAQSARHQLYDTDPAGVATRWQDEQQKAAYYLALARLKSDLPGSADSAVALLRRNSNPMFAQRLSLALAKYYFLHGQLTDAIPYYEAAGINNLSNEEIADAKFELAYAYFNSRRFDQAEPLFATIREVPGKYYSPGNYYYGLLAYNRGDYEGALKSFDRIDEEAQYSGILPYYMAEIQYYLGNRKQALSEALRLIKRPEKLFYHNELHLLAAQCLFEEGRYGDALPYFEYYYEHTDKIRKEELYEMGYSYYRVNEWQNAIEKFKPLSSTQDSLGQTAMYLLGDCYLKTGDKASARNAFAICSRMPYNPGQREAALLMHARLSYDLGYSDEALRSISTLLEDYPNTAYKADARTLQGDLYAGTSNYAAAWEALKDIRSNDPSYGRIMQRVAYGYGLQQIQHRQYPFADSLLDLSLQYREDPAYEAATLFWKGELALRDHRYEEALRYSQQFLSQQAATRRGGSVSPEASPANAWLNVGYASMELGQYARAREAFSKAQTGAPAGVATNATTREADALFMQKDLNRAAALYSKVAAGTGRDAEYARLQGAIIYGIQGKNADKMRLLQSLINTSSTYSADARYELGVTQIATGQYQQAVSTLQPLTTGADSKVMGAKAWLKTGTAYQLLNEDDGAIAAYRRIIQDYPAAPERTDALGALKSLYIERNEPETYARLLADNNLQSVADNELDSAFYNAAEARYAAGNWREAGQGFARYLQQYPNGAFAAKAHYYEAESHYRLKRYPEALAGYDAVLQGGWSDFSEPSALRAAEITSAAGDIGAAAGYYRQLRRFSSNNVTLLQAYTGLMQTAARLEQPSDAARYADSLLGLPDVPAPLMDEARLYQARQLTADNNLAAAATIYGTLQASKNGAVAAEARYRMAEGLMLGGRLKEAEEAASRNIKLSAGNTYWVTRSYILLGDILAREKDYFNAKATLQSVVEHATDATLKAEAARMLEAVTAQESSKLSNE